MATSDLVVHLKLRIDPHDKRALRLLGHAQYLAADIAESAPWNEEAKELVKRLRQLVRIAVRND